MQAKKKGLHLLWNEYIVIQANEGKTQRQCFEHGAEWAGRHISDDERDERHVARDYYNGVLEVVRRFKESLQRRLKTYDAEDGIARPQKKRSRADITRDQLKLGATLIKEQMTQISHLTVRVAEQEHTIAEQHEQIAANEVVTAALNDSFTKLNESYTSFRHQQKEQQQQQQEQQQQQKQQQQQQ
jgi:hypothetical protein